MESSDMQTGAAKHIVFLHGWGMNQGIWTSFLNKCRPHFREDITFECLDLPGFGTQADLLLSPFTVESIADNIGKNLKPNSIVVGWSMGGLIAQHLADISHPYVLAHVQIASTPKFLQSDQWPGIKPEVLNLFKQQLQKDSKALIKRFLALQCWGVVDAKTHISNMLKAINQYPLGNEHSLSMGLNLLQNTDLREQETTLKKTVPSLRIFGALDSLIPKEAIPLIQKIFPESQQIVFAKASHAPFVSHSLECAQILSEYVNTLSKKQ